MCFSSILISVLLVVVEEKKDALQNNTGLITVLCGESHSVSCDKKNHKNPSTVSDVENFLSD